MRFDSPIPLFPCLLRSVGLFCLWITGCHPPFPPAVVLPLPESIADPDPSPVDPVPCRQAAWEQVIFRIDVNGRDIGREVRSVQSTMGPMGPERIVLSHTALQYRSHQVEVDRFTVRAYRFLTDGNILLRSSDTRLLETAVQLSLVGFNGSTWDRIHEMRDSVLAPITTTPHRVPLTGQEVIGYDLHERLREFALGHTPTDSVAWYRPELPTPVQLEFTQPREVTLHWNGRPVDGIRVSAVRAGTNREVLSLFIETDDGRVLQESYPAIRQIHTREPSFPSSPREFGDPHRGLFSTTYLGYPNKSTSAVYHLISVEPITPDDFGFFDTPANQSLAVKDAHTLTVRVHRGSPGGTDPPVKEDLLPSQYVNSDAPIIRDALHYLKSGGTSGALTEFRQQNALRVVSRASRIENPTEFWADPVQSAELIADYVHTLLPDKTRTHHMKDALTSLRDGAGDCTEHSVLFAALMRAAGFPTRLVSGMYLTRGGSWEFHMWNEFFDEYQWRSLDSAMGPVLDPGAHYVAIGRGVAEFAHHRDKIAFFLDRSFSGLQLNMISASADGETLRLATPLRGHLAGQDALLFQCMTLTGRGDIEQAWQQIQKRYDDRTMPVAIDLLFAELSFQTRRRNKARRQIDRLRKRTSLPANVFLLDHLEFRMALATDDMSRAAVFLDRLGPVMGEASPAFLVLRATLIEKTDSIDEAISFLEGSLTTDPEDPVLLTAWIRMATRHIDSLSESQQQKAFDRTEAGLLTTHYADSELLIAAAGLHLADQRMDTALALIRHALILKPQDTQLRNWHRVVGGTCPPGISDATVRRSGAPK